MPTVIHCIGGFLPKWIKSNSIKIAPTGHLFTPTPSSSKPWPAPSSWQPFPHHLNIAWLSYLTIPPALTSYVGFPPSHFSDIWADSLHASCGLEESHPGPLPGDWFTPNADLASVCHVFMSEAKRYLLFVRCINASFKRWISVSCIRDRLITLKSDARKSTLSKRYATFWKAFNGVGSPMVQPPFASTRSPASVGHINVHVKYRSIL